MLSPLQLRKHVFTELAVEAIPSGKPEAECEVKAHVLVAHEENSNLAWKIELEVNFGPDDARKETPYRGRARIVGFFTVSDKWPNSPEQLASINGASVLYGAVREMVATLTARCSHGTYTLPTLTFSGMAEGGSQKKRISTSVPDVSALKVAAKKPVARRRVME